MLAINFVLKENKTLQNLEVSIFKAAGVSA